MTASLLSQLATSTGTRGPVVDLSTEAGDRKFAGNWAEREQGLWGDLLDGLVKMLGISFESAEQDHVALESAMRTMSAVQHLSSEFFADGRIINEQDVTLYRLSLESILTAGGENIPVEILVPSFESADSYSAEANEKAGNVLQRMWTWIVEQIKKIISNIGDLIGKFKTSSTAGTVRVEKIRTRLLALENKSSVSTEAADGAKIHVEDLNLIGDGGSKTIDILREAQTNTKSAGAETLSMLRKTMDVMKGFKPGESDGAEGSTKIVDGLVSALELKKGDRGYSRDLPIGPGNSVRIEITQGESNRISAKVGNHREPKKAGTAPGMSSSECVKLLDALAASYSGFEQMKTPMDSASRVFKSMAAAMDTGFKENIAKATGTGEVAERQAAARSSHVYAMFGTILGQLGRLPRENLSSYMLTQYAIEKYLDRCVDALEGKKAA